MKSCFPGGERRHRQTALGKKAPIPFEAPATATATARPVKNHIGSGDPIMAPSDSKTPTSSFRRQAGERSRENRASAVAYPIRSVQKTEPAECK
ncbi:hypothetical protein CGRA01v4_07481 [Colletotrichum graminicola]|uniref:Uncharacterized protein n=1 Tax=Colletotrichum graminicola (strain M1.001 / M2 / FGSC 10212) TaxID=645133 RepID=E3Q8F8_COLGM|nr:uncharacterized protein GLRG_02341 [Colletotrichum graminicola M1.001]EFQ27170.1 hypothetical protein GLRG_02341 [Colletotrichum graminicola M1.001]WDK16200.1 hypothetical protein CGRA01v4_07481 [Colletotrichum graminicola]